MAYATSAPSRRTATTSDTASDFSMAMRCLCGSNTSPANSVCARKVRRSRARISSTCGIGVVAMGGRFIGSGGTFAQVHDVALGVADIAHPDARPRPHRAPGHPAALLGDALRRSKTLDGEEWLDG